MRRSFVLLAVLVALVGVGCSEDSTGSTDRRRVAAIERFQEPTGRSNPEYMLAGSGVLATGGYDFRGDADRVVGGAQLHRFGGSGWERSAPPFSAALHLASGVWTGDRLIVAGQTCPGSFENDSEGDSMLACGGGVESAEFDPATNSWRRLRPPPPSATVGLNINIQTQGVGWSGRHAVFTFSDLTPRGNIALFDTVDGTWQTIPGDVGVFDAGFGLGTDGPRICAVDGLLLRAIVDESGVDPVTWRARTERWDAESRSWVPLPDELRIEVPANAPFRPDVDCKSTGEAFVLSLPTVSGGPVIHRFAGGTVGWQQLPPLPTAFPRATMLRSGERLVLWPDDFADGNYYLLEAGSATWRTVGKPATNGRREPAAGEWLLAADSDDRELVAVNPFAFAREQAG